MSRFPGFDEFRPPMPTIHDESVARKIATILVKVLNLYEFYWDESEVEDHVHQMKNLIMEQSGENIDGRLIRRLQQKHEGWKCGDFEEHCDAVGPEIKAEVMTSAVHAWKARYEVVDLLTEKE